MFERTCPFSSVIFHTKYSRFNLTIEPFFVCGKYNCLNNQHEALHLSVNSKFGKQYKLCSKIAIEKLYLSGREIKCFPFYLKYALSHKKTSSFQVVFVVPKKKFKLATTRNKIRRYIREAFRLEKNQFETELTKSNQSLALFLVYAGDSELNLLETRRNIKKLFNKLIQDLDQNEIK